MSNTKNETTEDLMSRLKDAGERIIEFKDETQKTLGKRVDTLGDLMKEHPLLAVGVGLGVGYVLARIIHR